MTCGDFRWTCPPGGAGALAYIGEGDDVSARLHRHAQAEEDGGKDFWDRVVVVTSKDANITKAHARYLESRLIDIAMRAGRCALANATNPPATPLPEADVSDMEYFLQQALIIFPVLDVPIFRIPQPAAAAHDAGTLQPETEDSPRFAPAVPKHGIAATAQEIGGDFTVLEGSLARRRWAGKGHHTGYARQHDAYLDDGTLRPLDDTLAAFTRNTVFDSPSAAAAAVTGRACNGRTEWRTSDGQTYGAWQDRDIEPGTDETPYTETDPSAQALQHQTVSTI